jgi:DNA replication protein DnaC
MSKTTQTPKAGKPAEKPQSPSEKAIAETLLRLKAGFPLLWVQTDEPTRAVVSVQIALENENKRILHKMEELQANGQPVPPGLKPHEIFMWDVINGLVEVKTGRIVLPIVTGNSPNATPAYKHVLSWANQMPGVVLPSNAIILVNGFHNLLTMANDVARIRAALAQIVRPVLNILQGANERTALKGLREENSLKTVILVGPETDNPILSQDIAALIERIEFPRPSREEISETIQTQMDGRKTREGEDVLADAKHVERCVEELRGSTLFQAENAATLTYVKHGALDHDELRRQYRKIIEMHPALQLASFNETWDNLVGFEVYKEFIEALFTDDGRKNKRKGAFFVGIPGGGKSHASKATGNYLSWKTLTMNIGRVFHKHVGSSEGNMDSMLKSIDACGESIVFVDEMEKAFGGMGSGGDSGVSDRVLERFLIWMNDHPDGPFLIGTANEIGHKLPQEFLREGRWDCIFFVPPPSKIQRASLFELYGGLSELEFDTKEHIERTDNWSGAEIKGLMEKARILRRITNDDTTAIERAYTLVNPLHLADPQRFQERIEDGAKRGVNVNAPETEELTRTVEETPPIAGTTSLSKKRSIT